MNHSKILTAYLSRISLRDMEKITEAMRKVAYAQLNNGTNEQLRMQNNLAGAVDNAVCNLISHDIGLISGVIESEV